MISAPLNVSLSDNSVDDGITIDAPTHCLERGGLKISGKFKISCNNETVPDEAILIPKHIVLVVTRGLDYHATKPFKNTVVFEDDISVTGEKAVGQFQLNVYDHIQFEGRLGEFYVLCSIGDYLSNIVKVTVS